MEDKASVWYVQLYVLKDGKSVPGKAYCARVLFEGRGRIPTVNRHYDSAEIVSKMDPMPGSVAVACENQSVGMQLVHGRKAITDEGVVDSLPGCVVIQRKNTRPLGKSVPDCDSEASLKL